MYINAFKNPLLYIHVIWFVVSKEHANPTNLCQWARNQLPKFIMVLHGLSNVLVLIIRTWVNLVFGNNLSRWRHFVRLIAHCLHVINIFVANHEILNKFDLTWGVKGLIVTQSNLVVTWKDRPQTSIISWFSLGLWCFGWVGCILGSTAIDFQFVPKIKQTNKKLPSNYMVA